jgi:hypothetical protein
MRNLGHAKMTIASRFNVPRSSLSAAVWLQIALIAALIAGAVLDLPMLQTLAGVLAILWIVSQWKKLMPLARLFAGLAALCGLAAAILVPQALPRLFMAVVQGTGFAALMMVLGLLRQPVKRAAVTRSAANYLLTTPPRRRYGALLAGAQFMALMFNVGIIAMVGDLTQAHDGQTEKADPERSAMVLAAMRGAALVSIWSPMSLGFAIVTAGVHMVDPMALIAVAFFFTMIMVAISAVFPMLPRAAQLSAVQGTQSRGSGHAVAAVLVISAVLLGCSIMLHQLTGFAFTLCTVIILPVFALIWLALERNQRESFADRLGEALMALADLRNEGALFLSANVIGAALSLALQASPLWPLLSGAGFASLPVLLLLLIAIPVSAALYLPNSVMVVLAAQVFGPTMLGQSHPLALGLTLCIGWSLAISVNPISAMNLIVARFSGVSASRVAHRWNAGFAFVTACAAAILITIVYEMGG